MRQISLCIPTYNRFELLFESFSKVYDNEMISEIIIVDDASDPVLYEQIVKKVKEYPKVKLFRNENNIDCYRNKREAISKAENEWLIVLDSDNVIDFGYIFRISQITNWQSDIIYTPSFAEPNFDFRPFSGLLITSENIAEWIDEPMFEVCLNACNYFVNRDEYLRIWDGSTDPVTSDSIFMCYNWLKAGNKIQIVPDLTYFHRVHDGSHYQTQNGRTPIGFHESILNKLRLMV